MDWQRVQDVISSPWIVGAGAIIAVVTFLGFPTIRSLLPARIRNWFAERIRTLCEKTFGYWPTILLLVGCALLAVILVEAQGHVHALPLSFGVLVCGILLGFSVLVWQEYRYARKAAYSEVIRYLHSAVHRLRDSFHEVGSMDDSIFSDHVREALDPLAHAFSLATRTACRSCVKLISGPGTIPLAQLAQLNEQDQVRNLTVKTLARDSATTTASARIDRAEYLDENTDFMDIFNHPERRYFMHNNLRKLHRRGRYRNSSIPPDFDSARDPWPLSYRSAIVWPIRKLRAPDAEVLGFLCVDSRSRYVFSGRYDFDVGALVADALYLYIKAYHSAKKVGSSTEGGQDAKA